MQFLQLAVSSIWNDFWLRQVQKCLVLFHLFQQYSYIFKVEQWFDLKVSTSPKQNCKQVPADPHIVPNSAEGSESRTHLGRRCPSPWSGTLCRRRATSAGQVTAAGEGCAGKRPPGGRRSGRHGPTTLSSWGQWERRTCHSCLCGTHGVHMGGDTTTGENINTEVGHAPLTRGGSAAKPL